MSEQVDRGYISFEMAKLEAIAQTYPEEVRENVKWLGRFADVECRRNMQTLVAKAQSVGFETSDTTFSKILRGMLMKDAQGSDLSAPIMNLVKLNRLCDKLRSVSYQAELAGSIGFVETATWSLIRDYIEVRRQEGRICKFGLVIGPTGRQKTASYRQYCFKNNHGKCVWIEAPDNGSLAQLIMDLGAAYGISRYWKNNQRKIAIRENVDHNKTIILDNIQRMYVEADDIEDQPAFSYLQKLQDETKCTIILGATPTFAGKFTAGKAKGYFEQFEGRCGGQSQFLVLDEFAPPEDVLMFAEAYKLKDAKKHLEYLEGLSRRRGRDRILLNALQIASQLAGKSTLTIQHVKEAMTEPAVEEVEKEAA